MEHIDTRSLFRLPWSASDNAMTWLEPTRQCNIHCDACFHTNDVSSRKSLEVIGHELDELIQRRTCDAMLIGGGEPLTHPELSRIVSMIRQRGCKPVLITNGVGLEPDRLTELKQAGLYAVTFHVDAHQRRPGWIGATERELNELRQRFADIVYSVGGMSCSFNITVFPDTLADIPSVTAWAAERPDRVQVVTFIAVRMAHPDDPWDYYAGGRRIDMSMSPYTSAEHYRRITADEIFAEIVRVLPHFRFNAFLGGTARPDSVKWAIGSHICTRTASFGSTGPRTMELLQNGHHLLFGRFLAYTKPSLNNGGRLAFLLGLFDPSVRSSVRRYAAAILRHPTTLFRRVHVQSLSVVQPIDILPTGEADTCDGCPNKTYWNGRIVPACRWEEYQAYGVPLSMRPKEKVA